MRRWLVLWRPRPKRDLPDDLLPEIQSVRHQLNQTLHTLQQFERRLNALAELTKAEEEATGE
jgi:hypothetical protein